MILRERPLTYTLILAMMLLSLQIFPEACAAQPKPIVEATQRAILEREGSGSVFFNSSIRIANPSDTSAMSLPEFTIGYPSETARNIVYFKATSGDTTLDVVIEETANSTSYKISLGELSQVPASSSINLGFTAYAHSLIKNLEPRRFSATIPDFPSFDVSVDIVNATVELPRNPDLESYPSEYDVMGKDELSTKLNLVRRDVLPETLRLSTFVFTYPEEVSGIQLLYSNVTRNYYLRLDGNLHVRDDLTFLNRGTDEIRTFDIIKYFYPNGSSAFKAQTVLGRALKVEKIGDFIDLSPSFKINQGESFRIILEYDQTNMFRPEGFLLLNQKYDLEVESSIPYLVENFIINVNSPVGSSDSWVFEDTSRHTRYKVTGEISFTVFQGINFIFRPVFLLFLVSTTLYVGFRVVPRVYTRKAPKELIEYLTLVKDEVDCTKSIISLDDAYVRREIRSKAYSRRKTGLNKRLKDLSSRLHESAKNLSKIDDQLSEDEKTILERKKKFDDTVKWLKDLEADFSKGKIGSDEYKGKRREQRRLIESYIRELEQTISAYIHR